MCLNYVDTSYKLASDRMKTQAHKYNSKHPHAAVPLLKTHTSSTASSFTLEFRLKKNIYKKLEYYNQITDNLYSYKY